MAAEVRFRPLAERDLQMLVDWLARPHVRQWWGGDDPAPSLEEAREQYLPRLAGDSAVRPHIAELDGEPIGFIQSYVAMQLGEGWWPDETDPGVLGIVRRAVSGSCARS